MNEADARAVTLLQAVETVQPAPAAWADADRDWATRVALQDGDAGAASPAAGTEAFVVRRARQALQRLSQRDRVLVGAASGRLWRAQWLGGAVVAGLLVGMLADQIGSSQRINLLAPPLWGVLLWNAAVYLLLLAHGLARGMRRRPARAGLPTRWAQRLIGGAAEGSAREPNAGPSTGNADALQAFARLWSARSAPLSAVRAAALLHAAAAALALGLIAGMYARGLVLDYRVAWESTFLDAGSAHAALAAVLAPASAVSGVALPDVAAFEALRTAHGDRSTGASAAPWIHLLAGTLALFVVLPRTLLAAGSLLRARWLAGHVSLAADEPYFQRLARLRQGEDARVLVVPYARTPEGAAAERLTAQLAPTLGERLTVRIAPTTAFGDEDEAGLAVAPDTTLVLALFDLTATPEADSQGRFVSRAARLAPPGAATVLCVDEAAFLARFAGDAARLAQRRGAWRQLAEARGTLPVFVDLSSDAGEPGAWSPALRQPVRRESA